jgi:hypothetical protein
MRASRVRLLASSQSHNTGSAATLFDGATLLIAACQGRAGCELTVISNLVLGRDDQIGCPLLTPIDVAEAHLRRGSTIADAG